MYYSVKTAKIIKIIAKQKGIKITEMLVECGLNKNTLSFMLSRGTWVQANSLAKIADRLDCSVDYLLGRTENMDSHKVQTMERVDPIMSECFYRFSAKDIIKFLPDVSSEKIENSIKDWLSYGWEFIRIEEEKGQQFLVLKCNKEGGSDDNPFSVAARDTENLTPIKLNADHINDLPTNDEE